MNLSEERAIIDAEIAALYVKRAYLFASRLKDCSARGLTTEQAVEELGISRAAIYNAAHRYGIRLKRSNARRPKVVREPIPDPDIIVLATVRATAIANRERATASQIARAVGTTRNAIIGHWFRARQLA